MRFIRILTNNLLSFRGLFFTILLILCGIVIIISCSSRNKELPKQQFPQEEEWQQKARRMVSSQISSRGISDQGVIRAMQNTPRDMFVPDRMKPYAYNDNPLPIGYDQTISQPYIVALMTELLDLQGDERVLEIGTGSGYQAAILSHLVDTCYSIEIVEQLAISAKQRLDMLGYSNVVVKWGDGYKGWPEKAPFDNIIITAAPVTIPENLIQQLVIGGTMVVPVGSFYQELMVITRTKQGYQKKDIIPVRFVPMVHPDVTIPDDNP